MAFSSLPLFLTLTVQRSFCPISPPPFSCSRRYNFATSPKSSAVAAAMAKKIFDTEEDLALSLAKYTAHLSRQFSQARGSFSLLLSGGSLVKSLRKLAEPPYIDSLEWSKWHVFWVDEKTIPKDQDGCNYKLAYDCFLSKVPILPGNVYAINEALSAEGAADDYETCLRHLVKCGVIDKSASTGLPKFDLMLMGTDYVSDGHIASESTGHPSLQEDNGKWVTFIHESPEPPIDIISLTYPVINSSAYMAMVMTGCLKMPVHWVSPEGELTWFLTGDAAETVGREICIM